MKLRRLLCWISWHDWNYSMTYAGATLSLVRDRRCRRCPKRQEAVAGVVHGRDVWLTLPWKAK